MSSSESNSSASSKGLLTMFALFLLGLLLWFATRETNCAAPKEAAAPAEPAAKAAEVSAISTTGALLGEFYKFKLPDGVEINIPRLGIENRLIGFIEDTSRPADKTTWFDFDRLTFDTGKATLQPSSQEQLQNVAAILTAFPQVKVKVGGYTDNVGNKAANQKLSGERATNVMNELVKLGIAPDRMKAEGYGEQYPVGDNATEEGRAKNRRISLRVMEK